jgi:hypothetical protein
MEIWEKSIKPTLYDFGGEALVCSNSAGKNPDNFFYNICTDAQYSFKEHHAPTMGNPLLPKRLQSLSLGLPTLNSCTPHFSNLKLNSCASLKISAF